MSVCGDQEILRNKGRPVRWNSVARRVQRAAEVAPFGRLGRVVLWHGRVSPRNSMVNAGEWLPLRTMALEEMGVLCCTRYDQTSATPFD